MLSAVGRAENGPVTTQDDYGTRVQACRSSKIVPLWQRVLPEPARLCEGYSRAGHPDNEEQRCGSKKNRHRLPLCSGGTATQTRVTVGSGPENLQSLTRQPKGVELAHGWVRPASPDAGCLGGRPK